MAGQLQPLRQCSAVQLLGDGFSHLLVQPLVVSSKCLYVLITDLTIPTLLRT